MFGSKSPIISCIILLTWQERKEWELQEGIYCFFVLKASSLEKYLTKQNAAMHGVCCVP